MEYYGLTNSLIGRRFTFFLSNFNFKNKRDYFLYEVYSPKLNEQCEPLVSLKKISENWYEKTEQKNSVDLIDKLNSRKPINDKSKWLQHIISNGYMEDYDYVSPSDNSENTMPYINLAAAEADDIYNVQVKLICELRDNLRWNNYRFREGDKVDVLVSPAKVALYTIKDEGDKISVVFDNIYSTEDVNLATPLKSKNDAASKLFSGKSWKKDGKGISEFNKFIKDLEYKALM